MMSDTDYDSLGDNRLIINLGQTSPPSSPFTDVHGDDFTNNGTKHGGCATVETATSGIDAFQTCDEFTLPSVDMFHINKIWDETHSSDSSEPSARPRIAFQKTVDDSELHSQFESSFSVDRLLGEPRHSTPTKVTAGPPLQQLFRCSPNIDSDGTQSACSGLDQLCEFVKNTKNVLDSNEDKIESTQSPLLKTRDPMISGVIPLRATTPTASRIHDDNKKGTTNIDSQKQNTYKRNPAKPPYTYVAMMIMAIETSDHKQLTLKGIREKLQAMFPFFRGEYTGWRDTVRHALSNSPYFYKADSMTLEGINTVACYWKVDSKRLKMSVFKRQVVNHSALHDYHMYLHDELGVSPVCALKSSHVSGFPNVTKANDAAPSSSCPTAESTQGGIQLPPKPCFHDPTDIVSVRVSDNDDFLCARENRGMVLNNKNSEGVMITGTHDTINAGIQNGALPSYLSEPNNSLLKFTKFNIESGKRKNSSEIKPKPKKRRIEEATIFNSDLQKGCGTNLYHYQQQQQQQQQQQVYGCTGNYQSPYTMDNFLPSQIPTDTNNYNLYTDMSQAWSRGLYPYIYPNDYVSHFGQNVRMASNTSNMSERYWPYSYYTPYQQTTHGRWYSLPTEGPLDLTKDTV